MAAVASPLPSSTGSSSGRIPVIIDEAKRWWHTNWGAAERVTIDELAAALTKAVSNPSLAISHARCLAVTRWILQSSVTNITTATISTSGGMAGTVSLHRFEQFIGRFGPVSCALYRANQSMITTSEPPLPLPWYHGMLNSSDVESLLISDGMYLIRYSESSPHAFVLCYTKVVNARVTHKQVIINNTAPSSASVSPSSLGGWSYHGGTLCVTLQRLLESMGDRCKSTPPSLLYQRARQIAASSSATSSINVQPIDATASFAPSTPTPTSIPSPAISSSIPLVIPIASILPSNEQSSPNTAAATAAATTDGAHVACHSFGCDFGQLMDRKTSDICYSCQSDRARYRCSKCRFEACESCRNVHALYRLEVKFDADSIQGTSTAPTGRHICNSVPIAPLNGPPLSSSFCSKCGAGAHYRCETALAAAASLTTSGGTTTSALTGCARLLCKACVYWLHYELAESTISTFGLNGGLVGSNMSLLGAVGLATR